MDGSRSCHAEGIASECLTNIVLRDSDSSESNLAEPSYGTVVPRTPHPSHVSVVVQGVVSPSATSGPYPSPSSRYAGESGNTIMTTDWTELSWDLKQEQGDLFDFWLALLASLPP
jgi:hypothetical protein